MAKHKKINMESVVTPISATPSVVTPTPNTTPNVQMAEGGNLVNENVGSSSNDGFKAFFTDFKWMEVILLTGSIWALSSVIFYYRFKLQQDKLINNELQRQIDEIKMNLQSNMKGKYKTI